MQSWHVPLQLESPAQQLLCSSCSLFYGARCRCQTGGEAVGEKPSCDGLMAAKLPHSAQEKR